MNSYRTRLVILGLSLSLTVFGRGPDPNRRALQLFESVRIPALQFRDADIEQVLNFLVTASRETDPDGLGINLAFFAPPEDHPPLRKITVDLRNIPLGDALRMVTEMSGTVYILERGVVRVQSRQSQKTETRFYSVDAAQFNQLMNRTQQR